MRPDFNDGRSNPNLGNKDQEPKDPRIATVIYKLDDAAGILSGRPRLPLKSSPEEPPENISWESADELNFVAMYSADYQRPDYRWNNLPRSLKERLIDHERVIPIVVAADERPIDPEHSVYHRVWMTLSPNPRIFQLIGEEGKPVSEMEELTGREEVTERQGLLPPILKAVFEGLGW